MPKFMHSINVKDFRSFNNKTINFSDVTCLIGANESGKTNLLDAIYLAKIGDLNNKYDKQVMKPSDTRKNSTLYSNKKLPTIEYHLDINLIKDSLIRIIFPN